MLFFDNDHDDFNDDLIHGDHLHISKESHATDSDGDGWSDAVERDHSTNHLDPLSHPGVDGKLPDDVNISNDLKGIDSDHDGFSDNLEKQMGTDPFNPSSHPDVVMPHHFDSKNDNVDIPDNLEGSFDVKK